MTSQSAAGIAQCHWRETHSLLQWLTRAWTCQYGILYSMTLARTSRHTLNVCTEERIALTSQ